MSNQPRLILASSSPRRRQLLLAAGYEFEIVPPDESVEQGLCSKCSPAELVAEHAYNKAKAVAEKIDDGIIIGADTVGQCDGRVLGKPKDVDHARQMLELMSGKEHSVLTGICLWLRPGNQHLIHVERTVLEMDPLDPAWLEQYLKSDKWIGKAGAFGFQDGLDWIRILKGSKNNVVGLPVELLGDLTKQLCKLAEESSSD